MFGHLDITCLKRRICYICFQMHAFFLLKKSKYGEYRQIEQEWTLINGHINNWTRTLDNDLMCDTRPIVKDTFAHTNTSMILGSCELLGFF